jgi:hypothetical protein
MPVLERTPVLSQLATVSHPSVLVLHHTVDILTTVMDAQDRATLDAVAAYPGLVVSNAPLIVTRVSTVAVLLGVVTASAAPGLPDPLATHPEAIVVIRVAMVVVILALTATALVTLVETITAVRN